MRVSRPFGVNRLGRSSPESLAPLARPENLRTSGLPLLSQSFRRRSSTLQQPTTTTRVARSVDSLASPRSPIRKKDFHPRMLSLRFARVLRIARTWRRSRFASLNGNRLRRDASRLRLLSFVLSRWRSLAPSLRSGAETPCVPPIRDSLTANAWRRRTPTSSPHSLAVDYGRRTRRLRRTFVHWRPRSATARVARSL